MANYYLPYSRNLVRRIEDMNSNHEITRRFFRLGFKEFYFEMGLGIPISASCSGRIIEAKENRRINGSEHERIIHNTNIVRILHDDGSVADYVHLYPAVKVNQLIRAGEKLGFVAVSSLDPNPHLHLEFYTDRSRKQTVEIYELKFPRR